LRLEGLFDPSRKRPLPPWPRHVALVTSPTGAAIRDMMNVLSRRNRSVAVTLVPTIVQGEGAALQICKALEMAFRLPQLDAVIVGRGGGSIEDLWAFNDENLARLIARSPVPIISAVGHEVDFTIADFVADVRAPTPSAAAELVVKSSAELVQHLQQLKRLLVLGLSRKLSGQRQLLRQLQLRLRDPRRALQDSRLRNDELNLRLSLALENYLNRLRDRVDLQKHRLKSPESVLRPFRDRVSWRTQQLETSLSRALEQRRSRWARMSAQLEALSPLKVLERGYSVVFHQGRAVKEARELSVGSEVQIRVWSGEFLARVTETKLDEEKESLWNLKKN
jgi:exodeoxyribonuclease VII large subunit